ncbi:MAG: hypothetical protein Q9184_007972 [Pyrenodesmia sp. 2 TL-2023]
MQHFRPEDYEGRPRNRPPLPLKDDHPEVPAPPSPSADTSNVPNIVSPTHEIQDPGIIPSAVDVDIFKLSPLAALKMLISTAEALMVFAADTPPTLPVNIGRPRVVSLRKENQPAYSRSSSNDRRKCYPTPPGYLDTTHVPANAKTPIGSPESKPTEPLHVEEPELKTPDSQTEAVVRKFNSKKAPTIPLEEYLTRLHRYCPMSTGVYLAAGLYICRLAIVDRSVSVTDLNAHRLLLAALRVATQANDDRNYPHKRYATVGGILPAELSKLELAFCYLTDFELRVTREMLEKHARFARDRTSMQARLSNLGVKLPVLVNTRESTIQETKREMENTEAEVQAAG